jgi:protein disulfide-isomerase A6
MKPAWDKLGDEYKSSKTVVIADVDCTKEQDLCQKFGVQGYPTIKYFTGATAATGDAYQGGRDYDTMSKWAKENLGPTCGAENIDLCTDDQKAVITAKQALSETDLDAEIAAAEGEIKQADTDLEELLKSLQSQYEAGKKAKDDTLAESPRPSRSSAPSSAPSPAAARLSSKRRDLDTCP